MSCAAVTLKCLVFIFNASCSLLGIGTIVVNALELKNISGEGKLLSVALIVVGSVVFTISFLSFCGAVRGNICLTWTYAVCLLVLVIVNSLLLHQYLSNTSGVQNARQEMNDAWEKTLNGTDVMAFYQNEFDCCGKQSSQDYINANMTIPVSCYNGGVTSNTANLYQDGCFLKLATVYDDAKRLNAIFGWATLSVGCAALVCACILSITFRNQQHRNVYESF